LGVEHRIEAIQSLTQRLQFFLRLVGIESLVPAFDKLLLINLGIEHTHPYPPGLIPVDYLMRIGLSLWQIERGQIDLEEALFFGYRCRSIAQAPPCL
jgi:hypothetical protein